MAYQRILNLPALLKRKSFFLLGPRATGKTFLIRNQLLDAALVINLLRSDVFLRLTSHPEELEDIISGAKKNLIVIDEIQLIPALLNEVHRLIEEKKYIFLLTGSSARKLKQKNVNLLAGRAWQASLFVLSSVEIPDFNLDRYTHFGGLPAVYSSKYPAEELDAYVNTYLKEEIQAEALIRKIPAFSRFLTVSAVTSGQMLNFTNISSDTEIPVSTVREYYQILEDTLMGFILPAWTKSIKRKAIVTAKFYYFDIGVRNTLANITKIEKNTELYGQTFEHFIALELRSYLSYRRIKHNFTYWRSKNGHEVDFLIGDEIAIEVKSSSNISRKHLKGLEYLQEENILKRYILVSQDRISKKTNGIEVMHWKSFLELLWGDKLVTPSSRSAYKDEL